ncbi:Transcriptional regulator containing an amidase domain and an AraC-type DNA-binding HTH domain [Paraburkholderia piptadeniae]|uniref:Transcriptional regulator containing an amidase domain and an AraC-type DNA-binding HTH domain n=1 Tax=Paraburkholderia piptadeniae TaxID=1701573 RepID=A0A1N7RYN3_9BURK|nr:GlxA family transcriptional regulator [Paraburkholderia piptadeniae]SIT40169.1 Transcriptional regulator containing an amidase domain and an AraC-type DNA-binding HTH domain [Paraburkholderia piptadeniae]
MRIALLVFPGVQMLDLAGPMDVFSEANCQLGDSNAYRLVTVAPTLETITASNGMRFLPDASIADAPHDIDTLLVAGSPRISEYEENAGLIAWLVGQSRYVRRLGSVCSGAFVLARAGLLTGRRATTHWNSAARLAQNYPNVRVEPDHIFVKDGPVYTSAGVTAGMDLALALVEEDHGRGVALRVARELVMFVKRPGGQSQYSLHLAAQVTERSPLRDIQESILNDLSAELSVEVLAGRAGMSVRNFSRMFKRETGTTPGDFVEIARVQAARRILEESDTPLKKVAYLCGFSDQNGMRRAFVRRLGVTPIEYRQRFRGEVPALLETVRQAIAVT